mgnify:CR=1 FL=1
MDRITYGNLVMANSADLRDLTEIKGDQKSLDLEMAIGIIDDFVRDHLYDLDRNCVYGWLNARREIYPDYGRF